MFTVSTNQPGEFNYFRWTSQAPRKAMLVHRVDLSRNINVGPFVPMGARLAVTESVGPFFPPTSHAAHLLDNPSIESGYQLGRISPETPPSSVGPTRQIGWYYFSESFLRLDFPAPLRCDFDGTTFWSFGVEFTGGGGEGTSERAVVIYFEEQ